MSRGGATHSAAPVGWVHLEGRYTIRWRRGDPVAYVLGARQMGDHAPWESLVVWFLASFDLGTRISLGYCRFEDGKPTATSITTGDGSWAEVTLADDRGVHHVVEGGPRRVWRIIENAHALWNELGQPGWDRFGLTVAEEHQRVWLDTPTSGHTWPLPPAQASDAL